MFDYFTYLNKSPQTATVPTIWPYIKRQLLFDLQRVRKHYRTHPTRIKSNHVLVRLLQTIPISLNSSAYSFIDDVSFKTPSLCTGVGFSGAYNKGRIHYGLFLPGTSAEMVLSTMESFNPDQDEKAWWDVQAVKFLRHSQTNLSLPVPQCGAVVESQDLSIICVDIPRLALQYRNYIKYFRYRKFNYSAPDFIARIVMPNMVASFTELSLLNYVKKFYYNDRAKVMRYKSPHPFELLNLDTHLDRYFSSVCENLNKSKKSFDALLSDIPSLTHANLFQSLQFPDISQTSFSEWILGLSRIDDINFLCDVCQDQLMAANSHIVHAMQNDIRTSMTNQMMQQVLPNAFYFDESTRIDTLMSRH